MLTPTELTPTDWSAWFQSALAGAAEPAVIVTALVLCTFLLEDLAIAAGVALAAQGMLSWPASFAAVAGGIALGDVALYALGVGARSIPFLHQRYVRTQRGQWAQERLTSRLFSAVLLARVIPGLRLLTYTACGFLRVPFGPFCAWVVLAVSAWTAGLYAVSVAIGNWLARTLGWPTPVAVALPIVVLALMVPLVREIRRRQHGTTHAQSAP
jgi:membrane protein DedA with SNARE-associated domain